ncbi:glycosyltransferase [Halomonas sp. 707D7]|uniref:glycosyltransferase n=2 Tax=unclassified Halomonas TaxID=2609666 RepID=UPI00209F0C50|nr:glycosyltransferase [Halomonas sp. 707D7]MCP1314245.1 glycosyltransferase [Halomonas sp. 707D7]
MSNRVTLMVAGSLDQRTGGYVYDARMVEALRRHGFAVDVAQLDGHFPDACDVATRAFDQTLDALGDEERIIVDGLVMGALPASVARHAPRLDITALVHHPLGDEQGLDEATSKRLHLSELEGLSSVSRIIVTSGFTAARLEALAKAYGVEITAPVSVVEPGVERAPMSPAAAEGEELRLLCVATLTPRKGQDVLVEALSRVRAEAWRCDLFGGNRDAAFTERVEGLIARHELSRVTLHGECDAATLEAAYQGAHVLVLPSWYEGYGMVITEALAHGLPVITTTGGALAQTLPHDAGLSVAPGDVEALTTKLECFLSDSELRHRLREGAIMAREALVDWQAAGDAFVKALEPRSALAAGSQFAADWLTLRESVDGASRSGELADRAARWLADEPEAASIVDLGCGRGSNLQFLAPRIRGAQRWQLLDHDESLLDEARERAHRLAQKATLSLTVDTHCTSLADLGHPALAEARLVSASALLDLASREWLEALAERCAANRQALLVALSVTGQWCFLDRAGQPLDDEDDRWALALFNAHQQRDKGLGGALGGAAHPALMEALAGQGYRVEEAATPWHLSADEPSLRPMMHALVEGWAEALTEQAPEEAKRIAAWRDARWASLAAGELGVWVGHQDLLALPAQKG